MAIARGRGRLNYSVRKDRQEGERTAHGPYGELIKTYEFGPFKAGDKVKLRGEYISKNEKWRLNVFWEILSFTTNIQNGAQWVDLWGSGRKWSYGISVQPEALKVDSVRRR